MRVAVVSESFLPTVNGVTTSVLRVLDQLAAEGHEAIVVCPEAGWVHQGADLTLAPSAASGYDLRIAGVSRVARWGRGVGLEQYHPNKRRTPDAAALRARLSPDGETVVGYVGRIAPERQVERLRALGGIAGVSLAIVGDGPSRDAVARELRGIPVTWLGRRRRRAGDRVRRIRPHWRGRDLRTDGAGGARLRTPVFAPRAGGGSTWWSTASTGC